MLCLVAVVVNSEQCQDNQLKEMAQVFDQEEKLIANCFQDLKMSKNSAIDTLISEEMLKSENIEKVCSQDTCIRALIVLMETLPDCCTKVKEKNVFFNFPRLADDILHQCDIHDARLLTKELEKEIAKLPDLKVRIKSLSTSSSSSQENEAGMDVIIDVKKREIMKTHASKLEDSSINNSQTSNAISSRNFNSTRMLMRMLMIIGTTMMVTLIMF
jgi:hypothetical protein